MNYIAFSLYGSDPKYCAGAVRNAELAPLVYPGWKLIFEVDSKVPALTLKRLVELGCAAIPNSGSMGLFWRFRANDIPNMERYIVRDCDSRLNFRERRAVDAWIASGKKFHLTHEVHPTGVATPSIICHSHGIGSCVNAGRWKVSHGSASRQRVTK